MEHFAGFCGVVFADGGVVVGSYGSFPELLVVVGAERESVWVWVLLFVGASASRAAGQGWTSWKMVKPHA